MNIGNIAFIDWAGGNDFNLSNYLSELDTQYEEAMWDTYETALTTPCQPSFKVTNRLDHETELRQELEKRRMPLHINLDLRLGFYPALDPATYQPNNRGGFSWETLPVRSFSETGYTNHPLFRIIYYLAKETGHKVVAHVICSSPFDNWKDISVLPHHHVGVTFYVSEDIRQPTRYLQALAAKMTRWARTN